MPPPAAELMGLRQQLDAAATRAELAEQRLEELQAANEQFVEERKVGRGCSGGTGGCFYSNPRCQRPMAADAAAGLHAASAGIADLNDGHNMICSSQRVHVCVLYVPGVTELQDCYASMPDFKRTPCVNAELCCRPVRASCCRPCGKRWKA